MQRVETYYGQATRLKLDRDSVVTRQSLRVAEWHLYGGSRLGIYKTQDTLRTVDLSLVYKLSDVNIAPTQTLSRKEYYSFDSTFTHKRGDKLYEGSNHLGNVLVTFSDKRIATCTECQVHYQADVRSATDYAAFGALLDDGQWYSGLDSGVYRAGFNGMEKDDEMKGVGSSYTTEFRLYDSRIGRWMSVDPLKEVKPDWTPYRFSFNSPLIFNDVGGDIEKIQTMTINRATGEVRIEISYSSKVKTDGKVHGIPYRIGDGDYHANKYYDFTSIIIKEVNIVNGVEVESIVKRTYRLNKDKEVLTRAIWFKEAKKGKEIDMSERTKVGGGVAFWSENGQGNETKYTTNKENAKLVEIDLLLSAIGLKASNLRMGSGGLNIPEEMLKNQPVIEALAVVARVTEAKGTLIELLYGAAEAVKPSTDIVDKGWTIFETEINGEIRKIGMPDRDTSEWKKDYPNSKRNE